MSYKDIKGSWIDSAKDINYENNILHCYLKTKKNKWLENKIKCDNNCIYTNNDGIMSCNNNKDIKVAILLTTCFAENSDKNKKKYYERSLNMWDKTKLPIFVVESSNYSFKKFKHLKTCSTNILNEPSSTQYEAKSILYALDFFKEDLSSYTHILKITGRYFLDIKKLLNNLPCVDLLLQHSYNNSIKWNNSEIFGFRINLKNEIFAPISKTGLFEHHIYKISKNYSFFRFPPIRNIYKVRRGGDKKMLKFL
jgi:hypothetical protein